MQAVFQTEFGEFTRIQLSLSWILKRFKMLGGLRRLLGSSAAS